MLKPTSLLIYFLAAVNFHIFSNKGLEIDGNIDDQTALFFVSNQDDADLLIRELNKKKIGPLITKLCLI